MKSKLRSSIVPIAIAGLIVSQLHGASELSPLPQAAVEPAVSYQLQAFDLADVTLGDGPFRDAMDRDKVYLLSLDPDRFLHTFRLNVGLPSDARPYGGWESPGVELRGHSAGHYLSACSLMYRSTGDETFKKRADAMVSGFAQCQAASVDAGFNEGYLSAFPESFIDRVEKGEWVWAPWYTLHKVMAGLYDAYRLTGNEQALDVLVKMADWIAIRVDGISEEQMQKSIDMEFGGMNEVLANLYELTGDPEHLRLAKAFDHQVRFDPLAAGRDELNGLHANTQIPKILGAAREYVLTGEQRYADIAAFFWDRVTQKRSFAFGGNSHREHFYPIDEFGDHTGPESAETCNTHNMLKLTRELFAQEPDAAHMDFYERALFNHILASQEPAQGMFIYMMPTESASFKIYSTPENSFWCCVGTGMENHTKYGDTIFHHSDDELFVNLFIPATVSWKEQGVILTQSTDFPNSEETKLTVECERPTRFALRLRHPSWIEGPLDVSVNGKSVTLESEPGSYAKIERKWKSGDSVRIHLPMTLHSEPLPGVDDRVAILYGPIVLAGTHGTNGLPAPFVSDTHLQFRDPEPAGSALVSDSDDWLASIEKVSSSPLVFQTRDLARPFDVTLRPLYAIHHERLTIYWPLLSPSQWQARQDQIAATEAELASARESALDHVDVGDPASESSHAYQGKDTLSGALSGKAWRRALREGFFSYQLKTEGEGDLELLSVIGARDENRTFFILADDTKLELPEWKDAAPGEHRLIRVPIPQELAEGKDTITIRYETEGSWNTTTANVFECMLVPAAN
ncbi:beta-L-arabinofuranosidase domain-containing protein [Pelagicoccus sp. SDUM812003]|uniref:beta-L-arabinofuranosidase domain-containing protein n=1 Tax=Pelagicoccus sp. SDUM812003 TaxID=3041267 RepID=UPI00280D4764|nr:beta-L-arabinofuranosidase domain-containing protein [Pelagicoccus sp. SDUM812003]MDQ8203501.1 glycoside hydrolase family 127 protein [Pelagicoccus sp. SDUM812003]